MIETWKPVPGWEDFYEVSDYGRVKSLEREVTNSRGRVRRYPERMLKCGVSKDGYRMSSLCANGRERTYRAHQLVALAFIGPNPEGLEVCHNDGHPLNNRPSNLRYDTRAGNQADRVAHGTSNRGTRQGRSVLNEDQVHLVRRLKGRHGCTAAVAKAWGVDRSNLYRIQRGENWSHLK